MLTSAPRHELPRRPHLLAEPFDIDVSHGFTSGIIEGLEEVRTSYARPLDRVCPVIFSVVAA